MKEILAGKTTVLIEKGLSHENSMEASIRRNAPLIHGIYVHVLHRRSLDPGGINHQNLDV
jgi:hypothetical protein